MAAQSDFLEVENMILKKLKQENPRYYRDMCRNISPVESIYLERQAFVNKALGLKWEIRELELAIERQERLNIEAFEDTEYFKAALRNFCGWEEPPSLQ